MRLVPRIAKLIARNGAEYRSDEWNEAPRALVAARGAARQARR
jgi:hypothetical protein